MKKHAPYIIMMIGVILFCIGIFLQVPSKELTTYSILADSGYSVIEEYVGGDAYNYIIGAALVGGEIAGATTQKAIFIAVGLLIFCVGFAMYAYQKDDKKNISKQEIDSMQSSEGTIIDETVHDTPSTKDAKSATDNINN